jgi:hypothetical protein
VMTPRGSSDKRETMIFTNLPLRLKRLDHRCENRRGCRPQAQFDRIASLHGIAPFGAVHIFA